MEKVFPTWILNGENFGNITAVIVVDDDIAWGLCWLTDENLKGVAEVY